MTSSKPGLKEPVERLLTLLFEVGRAVLSATWEIAKTRKFRASSDAQGPVGISRSPANMVGQKSTFSPLGSRLVR